MFIDYILLSLTLCLFLLIAGQLGIGCGWTQQFGDALPTVTFPTDFVPKMMGMGGYHSCFVSTAGGLLCFGRNYEGQLGIGDTQDRGQCGTDYESITNLSVIDLGTGFNVTQIQIMGLHNCVLNDQEQLKCFGRYSTLHEL